MTAIPTRERTVKRYTGMRWTKNSGAGRDRDRGDIGHVSTLAEYHDLSAVHGSENPYRLSGRQNALDGTKVTWL